MFTPSTFGKDSVLYYNTGSARNSVVEAEESTDNTDNFDIQGEQGGFHTPKKVISSKDISNQINAIRKIIGAEGTVAKEKQEYDMKQKDKIFHISNLSAFASSKRLSIADITSMGVSNLFVLTGLKYLLKTVTHIDVRDFEERVVSLKGLQATGKKDDDRNIAIQIRILIQDVILAVLAG